MRKMFFKIALYIALMFAVMACNVEPKVISYGKDHCSYCNMTVVDKAHAAEYVTKKGKSFIFDAVECMIMQLNKEEQEVAVTLVADFSNPGNLVAAQSATYLISEKIKSPMGANLSAFDNIEAAKKTKQEYGGNTFTWEEIKSTYKK